MIGPRGPVSRGRKTYTAGIILRHLLSHHLSKIIHAESRLRNCFHKKTGDAVLIVRVDAIGDFVLFRPSLTYFRTVFAGQRLVLLTTPVNCSLIANESLVDQIIPFERSRFLSDLRYQREVLAAVRNVAPKVAVYPAYTREGFVDRMIYASGASERIGFRDNRSESRRIRKRNSMFTRLITPLQGVSHEVERNKEFLRNLGATITNYDLALRASTEDEKFAQQCKKGLPCAPTIVLVPGGSDPRKMWPIEYFIDVASQLGKRFDANFFLIGSKEECLLGDRIAASLPRRCFNWMGKLTLLRAYALMKGSTLYLGNDTGPKHIAASAGLPVVEICCHPRGGDMRHYNSPKRFGAYGVHTCLLQPESLPPCTDMCAAPQAHCITNISPEAVFHAAAGLLKER